jgi:iron complex outermembrane recepter protein
MRSKDGAAANTGEVVEQLNRGADRAKQKRDGRRRGKSMLRRTSLITASSLAMLMTLSLTTTASAQPAPPAPPPSTGPVEKVTVTGSHIKRSRESTALPVDVVTAQDLEKEGAPTIVDVAKALPVSNGVIGDTNQFDSRAQGSEGTASINLRGLGPTRTLVLLNGRRLAINPFGLAGAGIVDTNVIPVAALDRIEVLKDGAAVTYGSDAIGGVVNFITKKGYDGLGLAGDWRFIDDAEGDYSVRGVYGYDNDALNILFSVGWHHRSELDALDREYTQSSFALSPEAGYSGGGNPGVIFGFGPTAAGTLFADPQCAILGGTPTGQSAANLNLGSSCREQYIDFDNLQEEEDKLQLFSSVNFDLSQHHRIFMDALFASTDVPHWETTPLYLLLAAPSLSGQPGLSLPTTYAIPSTHPGLLNMIAQNPALGPALTPGAALVAGTARPLFLGGNPLMPGGSAQVAERGYEAWRLSGGIEGELGSGLEYQLSATYSEQWAHRNGFDTLTNRFALALRGLGGPNCDTQPATPGIQGPGGGAPVPGANGCLYWNPFSNAIQRNVLTGQVNPQFSTPGAPGPNDLSVLNWFMGELSVDRTATLFVGDALITGSTGWHLWADDPIEFAFGAQYRKETYVSNPNDLANATLNPCVTSPDFFDHDCVGAERNGPFVFLGVETPADSEGSAHALFTEFAIPVFKNLDVQLAARYEDYGDEIGSTFDPKLSARWQLFDALALRGSIGSTFRGPALVQLSPNNITSLQFISGSFRAVDITGNPNLQPESAETFNLGAILTLGKWFRGTIDYWSFDFENPLVAEPLGGMVAAMFPGNSSVNCGAGAFAALQARFTFNALGCGVNNITRVQTFVVNGSPVETSGVDFLGDIQFGEIFGGDVGAGGSMTYVDQYTVAPFTVAGQLLPGGSLEAVGFLNYQTTVYPIPQWKGSAYLEYETDMHSLRVTVNYIDSYIDRRFAAGVLGREIEEFVTLDATYRLILPDNLVILVAIDNITDQDPPFARLDLSYDPLTASSLGRTIKVGIRKEF